MAGGLLDAGTGTTTSRKAVDDYFVRDTKLTSTQ
jgi:hypothetical protein